MAFWVAVVPGLVDREYPWWLFLPFFAMGCLMGFGQAAAARAIRQALRLDRPRRPKPPPGEGKDKG